MTGLAFEGPLTRSEFFAARPLADGRAVSRLGLGAAGLAGVWGKVDRGESVRVLLDAWEQGFLLTDTSPNYGDAELVVGEAIAQTPRRDLPMLLTKLEGYPNYEPPAFAPDWRACFAKQFETSLSRFHGRRIDGLAMHDPNCAPPEFQDRCAEFLEAALRRGDIAAGGIGGGGAANHVKWLQSPAVRYVITFKRIAALTLQGLRDTVPAAKARRASVIVASPLFMGLLGSMYDTFQQTASRGIQPEFVRKAARVRAVADQAGLSLSHLGTRFVLSIPSVDFMLAGAISPAEWRDTLAAYHAGPLPGDLYQAVWEIADDPADPESGG